MGSRERAALWQWGRTGSRCVCVCVCMGGVWAVPPPAAAAPRPPRRSVPGPPPVLPWQRCGQLPEIPMGNAAVGSAGPLQKGGGAGGGCFALLSGDPQRRRFGTRRRSARRDRSAADPSLSRVGSPPARGRNAPRGCARGGRGPGCPSAPLFSEVAPGEHSVPTPPPQPTARSGSEGTHGSHAGYF